MILKVMKIYMQGKGDHDKITFVATFDQICIGHNAFLKEKRVDAQLNAPIRKSCILFLVGRSNRCAIINFLML